MFEVIYMKAEYEPWWMFNGWEETIISRHTFENLVEAKVCLSSTLAELRSAYTNECMKKDCFFAFWSEAEKSFCEACDEDLQIYHGVILLVEGKPAPLGI
jgi:hypothetical protein